MGAEPQVLRRPPYRGAATFGSFWEECFTRSVLTGRISEEFVELKTDCFDWKFR